MLIFFLNKSNIAKLHYVNLINMNINVFFNYNLLSTIGNVKIYI
jgi:hypothetical protein